MLKSAAGLCTRLPAAGREHALGTGGIGWGPDGGPEELPPQLPSANAKAVRSRGRRRFKAPILFIPATKPILSIHVVTSGKLKMISILASKFCHVHQNSRTKLLALTHAFRVPPKNQLGGAFAPRRWVADAAG